MSVGLLKSFLILLLSFFIAACPGYNTGGNYEPFILRMKSCIVASNEVKEIDLVKVLNSDISFVTNAWMLKPNTCVLLCQVKKDSGFELILIDTGDCSIISYTHIPRVKYFLKQGWDNGTFYLLLQPESSDNNNYQNFLIKVLVTMEDKVSISEVLDRITPMPGGKTAIRETADRSLNIINLVTNEEELLLQGVPDGLTTDHDGTTRYDLYKQYVPCPDDVGYDVKDADGRPMTHPIDEDSFFNNEIWLWRYFRVYEPLDEHRFVYTVSGWEWGAGFGIYDLRTHTDHRITGRGYFYGMAGESLFGSYLKANTNTYETSPLPQTIQEQLAQISAMEDGIVDYDFSPDGKLLALAGLNSRQVNAKTLVITDTETGDIIRELNIDYQRAWVDSVSFYSQQNLLLLFKPEGEGGSYICLLDLK